MPSEEDHGGFQTAGGSRFPAPLQHVVGRGSSRSAGPSLRALAGYFYSQKDDSPSGFTEQDEPLESHVVRRLCVPSTGQLPNPSETGTAIPEDLAHPLGHFSPRKKT